MNAPTKKLIDSSTLYTRYRVKVVFRDRLYGGVPKNKDLIKSWIEASTGFKDEIAEDLTEQARQQMIDEVAEKSWNGFFRDEKLGLYIECRQVKAMIKQCASVLRITVKKSGSKQILAEGSEVKAVDGGSRLYLDRKEPDGFEERPIHVMTAQGPRTAIKRIDYVEKAELAFQVWCLKTAAQETRHIGEKELTQILALAQENGAGADRSQGGGKFDVVEFEKISPE